MKPRSYNTILMVLILACGLVQEIRSADCRQYACRLFTPRGAELAPGNEISYLPFQYRLFEDSDPYTGPIHYQQVIESAEFPDLRSGGFFILYLGFRAPCDSLGSVFSTNLQINLSTTQRNSDELTEIFSQNIGADETKVFGPGTAGVGGSEVHCPNAVGSSDVLLIPLSVPFWYDPANGNLLLNVFCTGSKETGNFSGHRGQIDAQNAKDGVSRIAALSWDEPKATIIDTVGDVTLFEIYYKPEPQISFETNRVLVKWFFRPDQFRLQQAASLWAPEQSRWRDYAGPVEIVFDASNNGFKVATIPASELKSPSFFRLFLNTPQPMNPGVAASQPQRSSTFTETP